MSVGGDIERGFLHQGRRGPANPNAGAAARHICKRTKYRAIFACVLKNATDRRRRARRTRSVVVECHITSRSLLVRRAPARRSPDRSASLERSGFAIRASVTGLAVRSASKRVEGRRRRRPSMSWPPGQERLGLEVYTHVYLIPRRARVIMLNPSAATRLELTETRYLT